MMENRRKMSSCIGLLGVNIIKIDDEVVEWLEADTFNITDLAKLVGIDLDHKAQVKITIEIAEVHCELCGKLTTGDKLCYECSRVICDKCAETDSTGRYCPTCFNLKKYPTAL